MELPGPRCITVVDQHSTINTSVVQWSFIYPRRDELMRSHALSCALRPFNKSVERITLRRAGRSVWPWRGRSETTQRALAVGESFVFGSRDRRERLEKPTRLREAMYV